MRTRLAVAILLSFFGASAPRAADFIRGDANADGRLSIADFRLLVNRLFTAGPLPPCLDATDVDDDGKSDIADAVLVLEALFTRDGMIPAPFPAVGPDPTPDDLDCREYEISEPALTSDALKLGDVTALPGELVAVPLVARSAAELSAFQIVVRYDPALFTPLLPETDDLVEATFRSATLGPFVGGYLAVLDFPEDGLLRVGYVPSLVTPVAFERNADQVLLNLLGVVSSQAPRGSLIRLEFAEQDTALGVLESEATEYGDARRPGALVAGTITVRTPVEFVRGDSNVDGEVNIADAIHMLRYLFLGGALPECRDAADVDDNGRNEISDSVGLLGYLFGGGLPPQDPWPACGTDDPGDDLDCEGYPSCE